MNSLNWTDGYLCLGLLLFVFCLGHGRGRYVGERAAKADCLTAVEVVQDTADEKHERFSQCVRRVYSAGFKPEHDPVRLCEDMLETP